MLARGAACDTCRARKVKCDASRPFCTPCLKSSRGDTSAALSRCKYEGVTVAAAREAVAAARGGVTTGHAKGRKRKSEMMMMAAAAAAAAAAGGGGGAGEEGYEEGREGDNLAATTTTKKISRGRSSSTTGGQGRDAPQQQPDSKRSRINNNNKHDNRDPELLSPPNATTTSSRAAGPSTSGPASSASSSSSSPPFSSPALPPPPPPQGGPLSSAAVAHAHAHNFQPSARAGVGYPPPPLGGQHPTNVNANANGESSTNGGSDRWPLGAGAAAAAVAHHHLENGVGVGVDYRHHHHHHLPQQGTTTTTTTTTHYPQQQRTGAAGPYNVSISMPSRGAGGGGGGFNPDVYQHHHHHHQQQQPLQQLPYQYHHHQQQQHQQQQQQRTATTESGAAERRERSTDRPADGGGRIGTLEQHPNETSHYDGRFVPYTFPAAAAAAPSALLPPVSSSSSSSSYSNPYAAGTSSSSSSLFNSNNPPALSSVPASAAAYTSSAHSFAGAGSPAYAQLQQQQQQANYGSSSGGPAGGGERGSLTPGSYPPMQLVPPPPPPSASADSHEQKGRGLSALSAAAAAGLGAVVAMAEEEEVGPDHQGGGGDDVRRSERRGGSFSSLSNSHPHYAYSNPYTTSSSYPYSSATAPNGSRSASPATWAAGITTTTTTTASSGSPLHFSNLRQQVSTYPRRGSEPDAYALSSPRGAAVSAIRGEQPTRPSSYSSFQPAGRGGEEGLAVVTSGIQLTTTVVSTPSNGEVSASGTTQATTPPLLGGSNGSSPQFKSAGVNNANNHHESTVGIGAMSGSAESIGRGNANANGSRTTLPEPSAAEAAAESASYLLDEFSLTPELYQILHPQYPLSLPPLSTLHHLLTTFFLRATIPSTMLSRAQILQSLVFGPADARWPEEALLHAMCAYAASFVSPDSLAGPNAHDDPMASSLLGGFDGGLSGVYARRSTYWEMEGDKNPREYHYRHAKRCILEAMGGVALPSGHRVAKRRNLLQVLQATILTCWSAYQLANLLDLWTFAGHCTRLATPLGLNHLHAWDFSANRTGPLAEDWGTRIRRVQRRELLGPAKDLEEHWERGVTFWMVFTIDRFASAITDLCTSLDEKDITTHMPCLATAMIPELAIDRVTGLIPSLSISFPSFLEESAVPVGSLGTYIRAVVLFGRVITFLQRVPRNPCELQTETCSVIKASARAQPDFIELDIALSRFKATHSANFFDAAGNGIDMLSTCAYILPHVATILLHEAFTDRYDRSSTSSLNRSLASAKCIVNAMTILYHSSYDLGGIDPFIPWCWSVTGRSLVRDYATKRYWGAHDEALASREMAESVLGFHLLCAEKKIPIAQVMADTLKGYLDNPETLLPIDISDYRQL
ncbi:hypothetical protein JCM8115_001184 [Rhodotorula mucilaginosa]